MAILLTSAQMREVETTAIRRGEATGLDLMERAGAGVVEAILDCWPELKTQTPRVAILCGPGNNGGDGFVVARLLHDRGFAVSVSLLGEPGHLPTDARINHDRWCALGAVEPLGDRSLGTVQSPPDIVIDALFGTGLVRPVEGDAAFLIGNLKLLRADIGVRCVAIDIPSGLCADSGRVLGCAPEVDLTVSFHTAKPGHFLAQAAAHCGSVVVKKIGLPNTEHVPSGLPARSVERPDWAALEKPVQGQKYIHGHLLVLSGGAGRTGAARLAARAALRVGAGLVTLAAPPSARPEIAAQITALMLADVADAEALSELLWDTRLNVICMGPGLGLGDRERDMVEAVLSLQRAAVLDADALSLFQERPGALFDLLHDKCVLTPHGGEFARLFPDIADKLAAEPSRGPAYSRIDAVRSAAKRAGCTVLLKGADTVIAQPDGSAAVHSAFFGRSAPWLATAGSGDVLAGLIAGLMARGRAAHEAAELAAWLHVEAARQFGPGLIAEDLPEEIPVVFGELASLADDGRTC